MSSVQYKCPSCGAPLQLENRFSKTVVCQYCGQMSFVTPAGLDPTGEKGTLAEFPSLFHVGAQGTLAGDKFRVLGRIRFSYEDGFWDEWLVSLPQGVFAWLQEDEGELTLFRKDAITTAIAEFDSIRVGTTISVNGKSVFVTEKNEAVIAGGEGELNFRFSPGQEVNCVDGNCIGEIVSIEFMPDEIALSSGKPIAREEVVFES